MRPKSRVRDRHAGATAIVCPLENFERFYDTCENIKKPFKMAPDFINDFQSGALPFTEISHSLILERE